MEVSLVPRKSLPQDQEALLSRSELAAVLPVSVKTLIRWAGQGIGPKVIRVGVAYRVGDVCDWLERAERAS